MTLTKPWVILVLPVLFACGEGKPKGKPEPTAEAAAIMRQLAALKEAGAKTNHFPEEVTGALRSAKKVTLYSLEPSAPYETEDNSSLQGYKILGQMELDRDQAAAAVAEFESAVSEWSGLSAKCFDPRHALRVRSGAANYELLLCYECERLYVYKDNRLISELGAGGSPNVLNAMLVKANIALSQRGGQRTGQEPSRTPSQAIALGPDLEREGKAKEAIKAYRLAAKGGNCEAARRMGDIYAEGILGVTRDVAESRKWYRAAAVLGCEVSLQKQ